MICSLQITYHEHNGVAEGENTDKKIKHLWIRNTMRKLWNEITGCVNLD